MNSKRICCELGLVVGIMFAMMNGMTSACEPSLEVTLFGVADPGWVHVDCHVSVDGEATGGVVWNWRYYMWPGGTCDSCNWLDCGPWWCGDPPPSWCDAFTSVGEYNVCVDVEEVDPWTGEVIDSAYDAKRVYAVNTALSPESSCVGVGGPRVRVDVIVEPAGPTADCFVLLDVNGGAVTLWDSPTDGNDILYPNTWRYWPVGSQPSQVWAQGEYGADNVLFRISYIDPYGCAHPAGCTVSRTDVWFTVTEVCFEAVPAGNTPDLPSGRICLNAQAQYKKAKYHVTKVAPFGTARVEVAPGSPVTDITFTGINGSNPNALVTGDYFWANGASQVGDYQLKLTHNECGDATDIEGEQVFRFYLYRGDPLSMMETDVASWGAYDTWDYKDGCYTDYSQGAGVAGSKEVYVSTDGGTYDGRVKVNARAVGQGVVEGQIHRYSSLFGDATLSISVTLGAWTATITVPGGTNGATAGGKIRLEVAGMGSYPAQSAEGGPSISTFDPSNSIDETLPATDIWRELQWERVFNLPESERLAITVGGGVGAGAKPAYRAKGRAKIYNVQLNVLGGTFSIVP